VTEKSVPTFEKADVGSVALKARSVIKFAVPLPIK
jgi:hypothetical protein